MLLTADEIRAAGKVHANYDALWDDVQRVADRVHTTRGDEQAWAWHHLLLAVANFKTQATLLPPSLPVSQTTPLHREDVLEISGGTRLAGPAHQVFAEVQQRALAPHGRLCGAARPGPAGARWRRAEAWASSSRAI
jgi:hypothetical protein